ncbi:tigger transposable element-derived protein 6-like [Bacillus rossius redtenbacheri]|uniref:tigger transposable element-derived protein 6-like n=1 Tax=Bacillus rossius redtenbacheri TaxID=93214 RepID=UPI002FDE6337
MLKELDKGKKQVEVAKSYGVAATTVSTIVKDRAKIEKMYDESLFDCDRKRLRSGDHQGLEEALNKWLKETRSKNVPVNGPMLQAKAKQFALLMDITDFQASSGWLHRFRERHGISWKVVCGEDKDADTEAANQWKEEKLEIIFKSYSMDDIFNADETAFFYKLLPNRTMAYKGEKCTGGKKAKERKSGIVNCNADEITATSSDQDASQTAAAAQTCETNDIDPQVWQEVSASMQFDAVSFTDYASADNEIETTPGLTDSDIISEVIQSQSSKAESDDDSDCEELPVTATEAVLSPAAGATQTGDCSLTRLPAAFLPFPSQRWATV